MGYITRRQSHIVILLSSLWFSGCAVVTAVAVVPGALIEAVAGQFAGEEESFSASVKSTLAATQLSLRSMKLDVDVLEIQQEGGYAIAFGNAKLDRFHRQLFAVVPPGVDIHLAHIIAIV